MLQCAPIRINTAIYRMIQNFGDFTQSTNLTDSIYIYWQMLVPYYIHSVYLANIWLRVFWQVEINLPKFCIVQYVPLHFVSVIIRIFHIVCFIISVNNTAT